MGGVHIPKAVRLQIVARVRDNISDFWYRGGAERVAEWAYRQGVRDERARRIEVDGGGPDV